MEVIKKMPRQQHVSARKKIFITTLVMPQGYQCQFKVYRSGVFYWDFVNDNHELAIHIYKGPEGDWYGSLSHHLGGMVQNNILNVSIGIPAYCFCYRCSIGSARGRSTAVAPQ